MSLKFPEPTRAKLVDVNTRSEKHGTELVPAIDLRFQLDVTNHLLAAYHPDLRELLYRTSDQGALPGVEAVSDATELRFPKLAQPLRWDDESNENDLVIDCDNEGEHVALGDCKVHKHVIETKQGGTCQLTFTCSCTHDLTERAVGLLGTRVQHDVAITLTSKQAATRELAEAANT
jgi:hypothetical protein